CELSVLVDGQVLVAHNARFDIGVLVASLSAFDVACPPLQFTCTRMLARAAWPGRSGYGLKPLGDWLGVQFRHHDALEDARCCARIALAVEQLHQSGDLSELEAHLKVTRGSYKHSTISSPRAMRKSRGASSATRERMSTDRWGFPNRRNQLGAVDASEVIAAAAEQKPLSGKHIVLLGPLRGLDMQESQQLISSLGGHCQSQIEATTDYVIACGHTLVDAKQIVNSAQSEEKPDHSTRLDHPHSPGNNSTTGIRLLSERQFRALLPAGKASASW
ncbi:MAG: exonuclease domain-containing protein, partial [Aureliella sp.]